MIADIVFLGIIILGLIIGAILGFSRGFLAAVKWLVTIILLILLVDKIAVLFMDKNQGGKLGEIIYQNVYQQTDLDKAIYLGNGRFNYEGHDIGMKALLTKVNLPDNIMSKLAHKLTSLVEVNQKVSVSLAKKTTLYTIKAITAISIIIFVSIVFAIIKVILRKSKEKDKKIKVVDRGMGAFTGSAVGCAIAILLIGLVVLLQDIEYINVAYVHIMGESKIVKPIAESDFMFKILKMR